MSHVAQTGSRSQQALLMTCLVQVTAADGRTTRARALLDSASSTSFMSEHLAQLLLLPRTRKTAHIAGIGGLSNNSLHQSVVHFSISPLQLPMCRMDLEAVVLLKVTLMGAVNELIFMKCARFACCYGRESLKRQ